jgi:hypothetical protein
VSETLTAAVNTLYRTFGRVPKPRVVENCPHCADPGVEPDLLQPVALRGLTVEDLRTYAGRALTTVGGVADFRYFLPRLLEIASDGEGFSYPDLATVLGKLSYGKWTSWAQDEQQAVRGYLQALWARTLTRDPDDTDVADDTYDAGTVLSAIALLEDDLTPYLAAWDEALGRQDDLAAALQLEKMLRDGRRMKRGVPQLTTPYLDGREAQAGQILAWLETHSS